MDMNRVSIALSRLRSKRSLRWLVNNLRYKRIVYANSYEPAPYPQSLMIEPTNICNLRCPTCPTGTAKDIRPKGFMSFDSFKEIIDQFHRIPLDVTLHNFGESFLNADLLRMVEYAASVGIAPQISTNGTLIKDAATAERIVDAGFDQITVSLDGASQETYAQFRKTGDFETVRRAIELLVQARKRRKKKTPIITLQFIVMKHNEHEMDRIWEIANEIGVDRIALKTVWVDLLADNAQELVDRFNPHDTGKTRMFLDKNGDYQMCGEMSPGCSSIQRIMVINWDGDVVPCCYDYENKNIFGNVFKDGAIAVWRGKKFNEFRKAVFTNKSKIPRCRVCPEGRVDILIDPQ